MIQNTLRESEPVHVAIIMDGNGRWAARRGLRRLAGHRAGLEAVHRVVETAPDLGVGTLTLFAFSCDNWRRPRLEVNGLMWLLEAHLRREIQRLAASGTRLSVIGRRDRLPVHLSRAIAQAECATAGCQRLHLRIALDYSARQSIVRAARAPGAPVSVETFDQLLAQSLGAGAAAPPVDLLIRTGGEKRLSDFLLWESAWAELLFIDRMWPEFGADELRAALADFRRRERRFGSLTNHKTWPAWGEDER